MSLGWLPTSSDSLSMLHLPMVVTIGTRRTASQGETSSRKEWRTTDEKGQLLNPKLPLAKLLTCSLRSELNLVPHFLCSIVPRHPSRRAGATGLGPISALMKAGGFCGFRLRSNRRPVTWEGACRRCSAHRSWNSKSRALLERNLRRLRLSVVRKALRDKIWGKQ